MKRIALTNVNTIRIVLQCEYRIDNAIELHIDMYTCSMTSHIIDLLVQERAEGAYTIVNLGKYYVTGV